MSAPYLWGYKCSAKGCNSKGKECRLFRFPQGNGPNGKYRVQKWLECAQNPKVNPTHAYLCALHFDKRQFRDTDRTLLIYGAMPTIRVENGVCIETGLLSPVDTSLQSAEDSSVQYLENASVQHLEDSSIQYLDEDSVQYLEDGSLEHLEDASVQYPVDTTVYNGEDTFVQDILDSPVQIPQEDTLVTICYGDATTETQNSLDGSDHIYAKNLEPQNSKLFNKKEKLQASHNNSGKITKASFTVYVVTPKSGAVSAVVSPTPKDNHKSSGSLSDNLELDCNSESFFQSAKNGNLVCESSSILDMHYSVHDKTNNLSDLHSSTSCKRITPREKKLIVLVSKNVRSLRQIKRKYENQNSTVKCVCDINSEAVSDLDDFSQPMSHAAVNFLASRVFHRKRQPKGRKWTLEDRVHALALYKRLPKCYALLSTIFALPSKKILDNTLSKITLRPGFNKHIFETLGRLVSSMDTMERTCLLLFDEMPLEECLQYDSRTDLVIGFEDWGHLGKRDKIGSHALVFVLKGLYRKWKQPVVFFFTAGSLSVELLRSVLQSCVRAGLNVVATVCNLNVNNTRLLKRLGASDDKPFVHFGGSSVVTLYNPPQLLMRMRDMLFKYDVFVRHNLGGKTTESKASWSVIRKAYDIDRRRGPFRLLRKLADDHVEPLGEVAEDLVVAAQVLSSTMAATICCFVSEGLLDSSALATAHFANFCNKLFDSINGAMVQTQGSTKIHQLRKARENVHLAFWDESISELELWKVMKTGSFDGNNVKHAEFFRPVCLSGWIMTLRGMKFLWSNLKDLGFTYVEPRMMNLDLVQHLFASVRLNSSSKTNPTALQFVSSLKTLMLNKLACVHVQESNCEERCDTFELLYDLRNLIARSSSGVSRSRCKTFSCADSQISMAHIVNYLVNKTDNSNNCDKCKQALLATTPDEYARCAAIFKAYSEKCPSEKLLRCVARVSRALEMVLPEVAHSDFVLARVLVLLKERVSFDWLAKACSQHAEQIRNEVLTVVCCALIPQWCWRKNRQVPDYVEIKLQFCKIKVPEHR